MTLPTSLVDGKVAGTEMAQCQLVKGEARDDGGNGMGKRRVQ